VVDANIIFDFACGGLLDSLFAAGMVLVTTDLVAEELASRPVWWWKRWGYVSRAFLNGRC